ncbi:MAG: urea transport system ATP-binding protein [bacterium]|jgi:urea transport system ATP-binding protein
MRFRSPAAAVATLDAPTLPGLHVDLPPILSVEGLEVAYGPTQVIFGVTLEVPDGGLCCLMGRNGVGKSTLLRTIVGLQPARSGTIKLGYVEITKRAPYDRTRAGIAYVPQGREAFAYLSVYENLRVVAEASAKTGGDPIEEALERFPRLRKILDRPAGFLSGGEAQQLAIARALVTRPKLLLLDEPTEGIQPSIILEIEDAIADLKRSGMSILLVEQYVDFAMRLADTYAVMDVGRIVAAGPTATFERDKMQQLMSV